VSGLVVVDVSKDRISFKFKIVQSKMVKWFPSFMEPERLMPSQPI
jgi:hypothetical protein